MVATHKGLDVTSVQSRSADAKQLNARSTNTSCKTQKHEFLRVCGCDESKGVCPHARLTFVQARSNQAISRLASAVRNGTVVDLERLRQYFVNKLFIQRSIRIDMQQADVNQSNPTLFLEPAFHVFFALYGKAANGSTIFG